MVPGQSPVGWGAGRASLWGYESGVLIVSVSELSRWPSHVFSGKREIADAPVARALGQHSFHAVMWYNEVYPRQHAGLPRQRMNPG